MAESVSLVSKSASPSATPSPCCCHHTDMTLLAPIRPEDCQECVQTCEVQDCDVQLTEQCTDQCVVVPCNDAHHPAPITPNSDSLCYYPDPPCTDDNCTSIDDIFQCCFDYHPSAIYHQPSPKSSSDSPDMPHWDHSLDALLNTANHPPYHSPSSLIYDQSHILGPDPSPPPSFTSTPELQPHSPPFAISQHAHTSDHSTPIVSTLTAIDQPSISPIPTMKCMWGNCAAMFTSMSDLVGHVNLQHLRLPTNIATQNYQQQLHDLTSSHPQHHSQQQQQEQPPPLPQQTHAQIIPDALSCLWADCHLYPTPSSVPGPSSGNHTDSALGLLASHLLQDHLGLHAALNPVHPPSSQQPSLTSSPLSVVVAAPTTTTTTAITNITTSLDPGPPTPSPEHDCSAPNAHVCRWIGCGRFFADCDTLTAHINGMHVGSGKAHYDCYWEGCSRNGESGFASKQKICRHLQSHTGHRPFQCKVCQQNFSEAATLAQHMRRHTQERPYVCDFPGCGKSFAITGALTIHKRTHNGHKPFKCTYCERAFAESSNLSKHLRTHTGARPYPCTHPECNKSFARPDQLARHTSVHKKKIAAKGGRGDE